MEEKLLKIAGMLTQGAQVKNIKINKSGLNSDVRAVCINGSKYIIKKYPAADFAHSRLNTEFNFLKLMSTARVKNVSKPIKKLSNYNVGIYSFLEGEAITQATDLDVNASADFIVKINKQMDFLRERIGLASDYFASYEQMLASICKRLTYLEKNKEIQNSAYARTVEDFVKKFHKIENQTHSANNSFDYDILKAGKVISPSDYGFHNTLKYQGELRFFDFEYAGIDNVVKLLCDFYCQPRVPVSISQYKKFAETINEELVCVDGLFELAMKFVPIFRVKWACIILNQVNKPEVGKIMMQEQIEKSRAYLLQD